ncbi:hypothetical protein K7432_003710 [Basidiobolus ranarum]|uniref:Uncharacterized protein n=1 Tax=Basidiobolus ranarum TaxID=34480 RepID=A0ABR2W5U2_9FUNG
MKLTQLFDSILLNAQEAKDHFERGFEAESFYRLNEISKTIEVLKDFKAKYASLNAISLLYEISLPQQLPTSMASVMHSPNDLLKSPKRSYNKTEKSRKSLKTATDDSPTIQTAIYQPEGLTGGPIVIPPQPRTHTHAPLEPELVQRLDEIFFNFLQGICSNLNAADSKGEQIHQTLMAKKMQKLDESPDFRPFKFRIQAFTNAFHEELVRQGFTEDILPLRKVKIYLWNQRYISRFNEDGKKAKSKGNHVWNIEAKKIPTGGWIFREFTRKIAGIPPKVAYIGLKYMWGPRVWDPQMRSPKVVFHSPWLPDWLYWENNILTGTPGIDAESCEITAIANYYHGDTVYKLEKTFFLTVAHLDAVDIPVAMSDFQLGQNVDVDDHDDIDESLYKAQILHQTVDGVGHNGQLHHVDNVAVGVDVSDLGDDGV